MIKNIFEEIFIFNPPTRYEDITNYMLHLSFVIIKQADRQSKRSFWEAILTKKKKKKNRLRLSALVCLATCLIVKIGISQTRMYVFMQ